MWAFRDDQNQKNAFLVTNLVTLLDLLLFIQLFWVLFFRDMKLVLNKALFATLLTFKLVCLGVLAIVLKRLENTTALAAIAGVGVMAGGPLISALILRIFKEGKN